MARPNKISKQPRPIRLYAYVNEQENIRIQEAADAVGLKTSVYLRKTALAQPIRPAKSRQVQDLIVTLNKLGADLNRVGNNINQLAHQANMDNFPNEAALFESKAELDNLLVTIVDTIKEV